MISISGAHCWPEGPADEVFTLRDIGTSLGRIPRFVGHTEKWYPVLAHVLTAAVLCEEKWSVYALFHDATETLMNDIPTPYKTDEQRSLERRVYARMCKAYGLPWPVPPEAQKAVKYVDKVCLVNEGHFLEHAQPHLLVPADDEGPVVSPTEDVMAVVEYHFERAMSPMHGHPLPAFFHKEIAGPIFEDAFYSYLKRSIAAGLEGVDLERAGL